MELVILIPTYNRRKQLSKTLSALLNQTDSDFRVIISDNASNYDVLSLVSEFSESFKSRITVYSRKNNVGADANIIGLFGLCETGWVWTLSDDDIVYDDAVETIKRYITKHPNAGCIDFFLPDNLGEENGYSVELRNIDEFSEFYIDNPQPNSLWHGDLIFLSNKVFNLDNMKKYVEYAYKYIYTKISTVVIFSYMLADNVPFVIVNRHVVDVNTNGEGGWNTLEVYLASRTLGDMRLPCDRNTKNRLLRVLAFDIRDVLYVYFTDERGREYEKYLDKLYLDLYADILDIRKKSVLWLFAKLTKSTIGYRIAKRIADLIFRS